MADVDRTANPNIKTLNEEGEWVPAVDPIHFDKPIAGVGPGRSFAMAVLKEDPSRTIGLVPSAVGGSPIASWEPGGYHKSTDTHPYDDALERARIALKWGDFKAILWHQGESDSNAELAPIYKESSSNSSTGCAPIWMLLICPIHWPIRTIRRKTMGPMVDDG